MILIGHISVQKISIQPENRRKFDVDRKCLRRKIIYTSNRIVQKNKDSRMAIEIPKYMVVADFRIAFKITTTGK